MNTSLFIGKIFGIVLSTVGLSLLLHQDYYKKIIPNLIKPTSIFAIGVLRILFGTILVLFHNIWIQEWEVIITVLSWFVLLSGGFLLIFPKEAHNAGKRITKGQNYNWAAWIIMLLGFYLVYMVFYHFPNL